ncbi:MAG: PfkB family carbohydrate kinase [Bacillota bacterium]
MYDVTALGELLIDFTPAGVSEQGNICFERNPGGAPANVLVSISRLGGKTAFIGKVGDDIFGHYLAGVLKENNIETAGLRFGKEVKTTLAFVQLDHLGDRSFSFYREPGADTMLEPPEVDYDLINNSKIFHFGSLSLTDEPSKSATLAALKHAKEKGCIISYDPNLRPALWKSLDQAYQEIRSVMGYANILKISEEELEFITGEKDLERGSMDIYRQYGIDVVLVTRGSKGCFFRLKEETGLKPTFNELKSIDTTGAGDAFLGGFLYSLISRGIGNLSELSCEKLEQIVLFSNAVASICTTRKGAIPAMPGLSEVNRLLGK